MEPSSSQPERDRQREATPHSVSRDPSSTPRPFTERPSFDAFPNKPQTPKSRFPKALAITAAAVVLVAGSWLVLDHHGSAPIASATTAQVAQAGLPDSGQHLSLSFGAAQLDSETTTRAVTAILNDDKSNPLIAHLSGQQKMEILTGERKFYKVPVAGTPKDEVGPGTSAPPSSAPSDHSVAPAPASPVTADHPAPAPVSVDHTAPVSLDHPAPPPVTADQPAPPPDAPAPQMEAPASAPAPASQPSTPYNDGRVRVDFDGSFYADYDLSTDLSSIVIPVKNGDTIGVTCLSAGQEHRFVCFRIVDSVGPIESQPLFPGERQTWTVRPGTADYSRQLPWLQAEAAKGNSVAEDGLGYVYEHGMGVAADQSQAVYWYKQAAAHGSGDAQARLQSLGY